MKFRKSIYFILIFAMLFSSIPVYANTKIESSEVKNSSDVVQVESEGEDSGIDDEVNKETGSLDNSLGNEENHKDKTDSEEVIADTEKVNKEDKLSQDKKVTEMAKIMLYNDEDGNKIVNTVIELQDAVSLATEGEVITLGYSFTFENATITMPNVNVTIDGGDKIWSNGTIKVEGAGTGSLTIKNLKMDGSNNGQELLLNKDSNAGKLVLDNMEFYNSKGGAIRINAGEVEINRVYIHDNTAVNRGAAVSFADNSSANVTIKNSTIENNIGTGGGYESGAISSKFYSGILNINNTVFRNNINKASYTGVIGGGGGAIFFNGFNNGKLNINESIFEGNSTNGSDGSTSATYDGGAIYIFNMKKDASLEIKNTSFIKNIAYDDGGAILIQTEGSGNGDIVKNILLENNTFYGNKAYGIGNAMYSGGAIQVYGNVGFRGELHTKGKFKGNTFAYNEVGGNTKTGYGPNGGAIGLSLGFSPDSTIEMEYENNLFAGNAIVNKDGSKNFVSPGSTISSSDDIDSGYDNELNMGIKPYDGLINDVLGKYNVEIRENYTKKVAGVSDEPILTIPIKPEGVAENKSSEQSGSDQRGFDRFKDYGAVEISWVKYDANGGTFKPEAMGNYDGTKYFELDGEGKTTIYYTVGYINGDTKVVYGEGVLKASKEDEKFLGWSTDANATEPDVNYESGKDIKYINENTTLYAIWGDQDEKYTVTYDGNGADSGIVPVDSNEYNKDAEVTVLDKDHLEKINHKFIGWNTQADGSGTMYKPNSTFEIQDNTRLYAIWELKDVYRVIYDGNGNTSGTAPTDVNRYFKEGTVIVKDKHTLVKSGYTFKEWNTEKDGTGISYKPNDTFIIIKDTILYAQWVRDYVPTESEIQEPSEPVAPDPVPELNKKDHYAYMVGESDKNFRPNDNITRAEAITIFFRMLTENSRNQYWSTVNNFNDVKETAWYNNAVSTMANAKVIEADANGNFRPNEAMTRGEFAVLLSKFFNETGTKTHNFTDIKGHAAEEEIAKVAAKGWIEGYADKTFRPDEKITRAETVKLVNRILERTPDAKNLLPNMIEFKDNQDVDKWYYVEIQEAANSHEYTRKDVKSTETWTKLLPVRDWVALEKEWSKANSSTNPGNVK